MTRKKAAPKKKSAARKKPARKPEPSDQPGRRFRELAQDRRFGSEGKNLARLRLAAVGAREAMRRGTARAIPVPGASNWVQLGPMAIPNGQTNSDARVLVSGRITGIAVGPSSPATIYVSAARGGVWKSTDGGVNWTPKGDDAPSLAIGALAMAPSDSQRLYAGTGEGNIFYYAQVAPFDSVNADYHGIGILRSDDGGETWSHLGAAELTGAAFYRIAVQPSNPDVVFGATTLGLMRSTDGGASWQRMTTGLPELAKPVVACCDVAFDPQDPTRVYCAFFGGGIFVSTNALSAAPAFTQMTAGLPLAGLGRIVLCVAPSDPHTIFAAIASATDSLLGIFTSADKGANWSEVDGARPTVEVYGAYTLDIGVDIATTSTIYVCGVSLYKGVKNGAGWTFTEIGGAIHPDNHVLAFHPSDHLTVWVGNDGGIYRTSDGGATWDDALNEGLCITQFEFMGLAPSDAIALAGTQDNGTEMYRNSPVFHHSGDGDGGASGIDPVNPNNCIRTQFGTSPERSTRAGEFGSYVSIRDGLSGHSLFYPPWTFADSDPNKVAFGLALLKLSNAQGTDRWPGTVTLPGIGSGLVSAIHYVNANLIYCATTDGKVYKWTGGGSATLISAAPLPARWIWDVQLVPGSADNVVVAMAGFGTPHVWRGRLTAAAWTWTDISGTGAARLPDAPVNSLQIDAAAPSTIYAGTDIGVFRTQDGGVTWQLFSQGLPNVAVYDLKLHAGSRVLRAATHGRGLWERKLDVAAMPDVRLLLRDHPMDTGRPAVSPVAAGWADPRQPVNLNDPLFWWHSADIKVDAPVGGAFQLPVAAVDYLAFETKLAHRNPMRGALNRVYVQVHNRGIARAANVTVKVLFADASPGLSDLPADFFTAFPADAATGAWKAVAAAKTISVAPTRPEVVEFDWTLPAAAAQHASLLAVVQSADDPVAQSFEIATLVPGNRQVALRSVHLVAAAGPVWQMLSVTPRTDTDPIRVEGPAGARVRVIIPTASQAGVEFSNLKRRSLTAAEQNALRTELGATAAQFDTTAAMEIAGASGKARVKGIRRSAGAIAMWISAPGLTAGARVDVIHESGGRVLGGATFVFGS
ncbi:MAG: hypothetical protein U0Q16_09650 [Bryobacteraceae bacterium]